MSCVGGSIVPYSDFKILPRWQEGERGFVRELQSKEIEAAYLTVKRRLREWPLCPDGGSLGISFVMDDACAYWSCTVHGHDGGLE